MFTQADKRRGRSGHKAKSCNIKEKFCKEFNGKNLNFE